MQILTGSKRTITVNEWVERINKREKELKSALACVRHYVTIGDIDHAVRKIDSLKLTLLHFSAALEYMNKNNIQ